MDTSRMNGVLPSSSAGPSQAPKHIRKASPDFEPLESSNWLIHTRYVRKEFDICKLLIEEELEKSSGCNEFANYIMGLICRYEGKVIESIEFFKKCHLLNPTNSDNIKQIGRSLVLMGHHSLAIEAYTKAEQSSKTADHSIHHNLGISYMNLGKFGKAREHLRKAAHFGRTEESYLTLAELFILENDYNSAIEVYNAGLELFPSSCKMATNSGLLYRKFGDDQRAFDRLGTALANSSKSTKSLLGIGAILHDHGEFDEALHKYKIAGQFLSESPALWNNMGMCFFGKGKYVAAISCLKRAVFLNPTDWKSLYNLGLVHLHIKQYSSAFHYLSSAVKIKHKHALSFMLLGLALKNMGDMENATKCFSQGVKLDPDDAAIRVNFIVHLCNVGKEREALEHLQVLQGLIHTFPNIDNGVIELAKQLIAALSSTTREQTIVDANTDSQLEDALV